MLRAFVFAVVFALGFVVHCARQRAPALPSPPAPPSPSAAVPADVVERAPSCGVERRSVKLGMDPDVGAVSSTPVVTTIDELRSQARSPGDGATRAMGVERTLYELRNVRLVCLKSEEDDGDYHLVIEDSADPETLPAEDPHCKRMSPRSSPETAARAKTMIVEMPSAECLPNGARWRAEGSTARQKLDDAYRVTRGAKRVSAIVSVRGVGFFDRLHGQLGVAPNAVELHPVVAICFGKDCALDSGPR